MTKPIDEGTWARLRSAVSSARRLGLDQWELLNKGGLILTPALRRNLLAAELRKTARDLENTHAMGLLMADNRSGNNALDMQRAVTTWLRRRADKIEEDRS